LSLLPPRSDGQPGAPRGDDLLLSSIYAKKQESFLRRFGKQIAIGIASTFVVTVIMNLKYVHFVVLWACQIVIFIFGRPAGAEKLERLEEKAAHVVEKVKDAAHAHAGEVPVPKAAGPVGAAIAAGNTVKKVKEEVHAVREVAGKVKAVEQKAGEVGSKIADAGHDVAGAIKGMGSHATEAVGGMAAHIAEAKRARHEAQEKAMHDQLIVRARAAGVTVDASWSVARLAAEVNMAEEVAWRKRYNAQCPNPRCHKPLRINPSSPAWKTGNCIYCGGRFYLRAGINLGPPPRRGR
jgi:hypothetical protein